VMTPVYPPKK